MKRVELNAKYGEFQPGATIEVEDDIGEDLLKRGRGKLALEQKVYTTIDDMPVKLQEQGLLALAAADAAGPYSNQPARAAATAPFRKQAK